ncbi:hypothetical protein A3A79_05280 [Candidatus Gottesmanbacteria bacterium RIFCSPLOWO2_01_FULL_43_11b]|uniref:BioF2-like acetyltransferase domain-containing protein n=1 Tax=Candidatus Gottesmanbacteria bacterium RIFCSPLOWO2_01_FULL_43_11b TaxID=1798392 RepID=A0A1F6AIQ4_9BACT|nr:MAG: hypothetical protein A3A79_05280 [Candidatus Gottesmanbacteria bacterium RIFCSPLOWO2_01_FULL_43_11b]
MTPQIWEQFLIKYSPSALFQSWKWGEVEKKLGNKIWRLEWEDDAIALVVKVTARRGTFLHIRHGPVVSDKRYFKKILSDLIELAKKEHAWFVRISPQVQSLPDLGLVSAPIHAMDAELCWVLDLDKSEEDLLSNMRKTTRYEIKHAQEVTVEKTKKLERFFHLYDATSTRHKFVQHTGIREEFETLDAELFVASHQGTDLAAAIIVYYGDQAIYRHGASLPSKVPASYTTQWEAIREAKYRGKKLYNFWGIAPEDKLNHPWRGITLFKKGFGGREIKYIHAQDLPISPLYTITRSVETMRRIVKGY